MFLPERVRRVTVLTAAVLIGATVFVGARGSGTVGGCAAAHRQFSGASWREGTLHEAGCRAWRHLRTEMSETR